MGVNLAVTGGGINLNDRVNYFLRGLSFDKAVRDEEWLFPAGSEGLLVGRQDRPRKCLIALRVRGDNMNQLINIVQNLRDEFWDKNNTIEWTREGQLVTIQTYKTAIDPVDLSPRTQNKNLADNDIPLWEFSVWSSPYDAVTGQPIVI
jgi:hypothetical protein